MRKRSAFRPSVGEGLEDRTVPSRLGVSSPTAAVGRAAATPTPQAAAVARLGAAFGAFERSFLQAVEVDLVAPAMTGSGGSGGNAPFLSGQIGRSLAALEAGVVKAMGHPPAGSPAVAQVRRLITGPGPYSLEGRLGALTLAAEEQGTSIPSYEAAALQDVRQTYARVEPEVLASLPVPAAPPAAGQGGG